MSARETEDVVTDAAYASSVETAEALEEAILANDDPVVAEALEEATVGADKTVTRLHWLRRRRHSRRPLRP